MTNERLQPTPSGTISEFSGLLTEVEAAMFLNVAPGTLSVWRSTGRYNLPYVKIGHKIRYRKTDLLHWLSARMRQSEE